MDKDSVFPILVERIRAGDETAFQRFYLLTAWKVIETVRRTEKEETVKLMVETVYAAVRSALRSGYVPEDVFIWLKDLTKSAKNEQRRCSAGLCSNRLSVRS